MSSSSNSNSKSSHKKRRLEVVERQVEVVVSSSVTTLQSSSTSVTPAVVQSSSTTTSVTLESPPAVFQTGLNDLFHMNSNFRNSTFTTTMDMIKSYATQGDGDYWKYVLLIESAPFEYVETEIVKNPSLDGKQALKNAQEVAAHFGNEALRFCMEFNKQNSTQNKSASTVNYKSSLRAAIKKNLRD